MQLNYDGVYGHHCEITLLSGRAIRLSTLQQEGTYAGMLVGMPNAVANGWVIDDALAVARKQCVQDAAPHLIEPIRRNYRRRPGDMDQVKEFTGASWDPEWMPSIRCIAQFSSSGGAGGRGGHTSELVVIWFQETFALPIEDTIFEKIRSLDWEALASSYYID